ncbi:MAG: elongation factor Ts [Candidatus Omnitrophica bacterium]|nr:elongation factor Ts [Candidatus Omnitrophota bacterium]
MELIKKLRALTGAGIMDCKRALEEASGNFDKALEHLKKRGDQIAQNKAGRTANQGLVESYVHTGGKIGVLVEVNCETDFVARCDDFKRLARDLAMQIAAASPTYLQREDIPPEVLEGKKGNGLETFCKERCLLEQPFIKDQMLTVRDLLTQVVAKVGENIVVRRFVRFQLGGS